MKGMTRIVGLSLAASLLIAGSAAAHHSGAMFDRAVTMTLKGVIKRYTYTNPHTYITLVAPGENGRPPVEWTLEGGPVQVAKMVGLTPSNLQEGLKVTARTHPLRDGRPGGSIVDVTLADGKIVGVMSAAAPGPPAAAAAEGPRP